MSGHFDMEALETAIRSSMHHVGGVMLEKLINSDGGGYRGVSIACSCKGKAEFVEYRDKGVTTMLSPVNVKRAYYHCSGCGRGQLPNNIQIIILQGLFVGSGVVEAGCKTVIGARLKQSGMRWTVRGANAIISLRCCYLSGRWEDFWENRATG